MSALELNEEMNKEQRLNWIMDQYGTSIYRLAYTFVRSKPVAEDITQDVFLKCYENLDDFRGESSYKTWLYRITVNKCKDYLKSWSFKNLFFTDVIRAIQKSSYKAVEEEYLSIEEHRIISEKVLSLPLIYREVIILHFYEFMSLEEISNLISVNQNTIKSRLLRGKKLLEKRVKGAGLLE